MSEDKKALYERYLRKKFQTGQLTTEQIARLEKIGFHFDKKRLSVDERISFYETLFKRLGDSWWESADKSCRLSISYIRRLYRDGKLSTNQVSKLKDVSFPFTVEAQEYLFEKKVTALESLARANCGLLPSLPRYKSGGVNYHYYAQCLREKYENGQLSKDHFKRLSDIGFCFDSLSKTRPVICWETGEKFDSIVNAARKANVTAGTMRKACENLSSCGGWHWYYADCPRPKSEDLKTLWMPWDRPLVCIEDNTIKTTIEELTKSTDMTVGLIKKKIRRGKDINGRHYWPENTAYNPELILTTDTIGVTCYETGEYFESAEKAALSVNLKNKKSIIHAARLGRTAGGFHWYLGSEIPEGYSFHINRNSTSVICIETGAKYPSIQQAAKETGCDASKISRCCRDGGSTRGLHWIQEGDDAVSQKKQYKRPVICVETNQVYESIAEANASHGEIRRNPAICAAIKNQGEAYGYHWEYVDG